MWFRRMLLLWEYLQRRCYRCLSATNTSPVPPNATNALHTCSACLVVIKEVICDGICLWFQQFGGLSAGGLGIIEAVRGARLLFLMSRHRSSGSDGLLEDISIITHPVALRSVCFVLAP